MKNLIKSFNTHSKTPMYACIIVLFLIMCGLHPVISFIAAYIVAHVLNWKTSNNDIFDISYIFVGGTIGIILWFISTLFK